MDNNKLIILILCGIIAILCIGIFLSPLMAKEDCKLTVSNKKINEGASFVVKLTDMNKNPISNETVHFKITDKDGNVIDKDAVTNSKGKAKVKMNNIGKYTVDCGFDGNNKYSANFTSVDIKVNTPKTELVSEDKTSNYDSVSGLSEDGYSYYPSSGPNVDAAGTTREFAIANNWHYIPQTIDGVDAGLYTPYDSVAGCYHT